VHAHLHACARGHTHRYEHVHTQITNPHLRARTHARTHPTTHLLCGFLELVVKRIDAGQLLQDFTDLAILGLELASHITLRAVQLEAQLSCLLQSSKHTKYVSTMKITAWVRLMCDFASCPAGGAGQLSPGDR